jgi:hypothetical protein
MKAVYFLLVLGLVACGSDDKNATENVADLGSSDGGVDSDVAVKNDAQVVDALSEFVCNYTNPFSRGDECRAYVGSWTEADVAADCLAQQGEVVVGTCAADSLLGTCEIPAEGLGMSVLHAYGEASSCNAQSIGCRVFAKGEWKPEAVCDGGVVVEPQPETVFQPPVLVCKDPLPGEPAGMSEGGQVCTWQLVSGATEPGRKFKDYADCGVVRTQRPYYPYPRPDDAEKDDPRMNDSAYVAELNWVKSEIESSACVCCHQSSLTPDGPSNWDIDQPGNFMNGFYDKGLALGANWVNSEALGAFPPQENNGFDRQTSGFPSTDPQRMTAFFVAELLHRGKQQADFAQTPPFGGPLYDQIYYEPAACGAGIGVDATGKVTWDGGPARYVYVLEQGAKSPTIPPNLVRPVGTLWRLDVAPTSEALESGSVTYGVVPSGASQTIPAEGAAPELVSGSTYYLYVSKDVGIPLTRCLFVAP